MSKYKSIKTFRDKLYKKEAVYNLLKKKDSLTNNEKKVLRILIGILRILVSTLKI